MTDGEDYERSSSGTVKAKMKIKSNKPLRGNVIGGVDIFIILA